MSKGSRKKNIFLKCPGHWEGWGVRAWPLRKKNFFWSPKNVATKLEGGPLEKNTFVAASLKVCAPLLVCRAEKLCNSLCINRTAVSLIHFDRPVVRRSWTPSLLVSTSENFCTYFSPSLSHTFSPFIYVSHISLTFDRITNLYIGHLTGNSQLESYSWYCVGQSIQARRESI